MQTHIPTQAIRILVKWEEQAVFLRFRDGDIHNAAADNLQPVSLPEALAHLTSWRVDWDSTLTHQEVLFVLEHAEDMLLWSLLSLQRVATPQQQQPVLH